MIQNETVQALKNEIVENLNSYVHNDFKAGSTLATVFIDGEDDLTIRINISCHNLNFKNFWGGEWQSTWDISHRLGSETFALVGRIKLNNHYFELGNIQFNMNKNFENEIEGHAEAGSIAKGIVSLIRKNEEEYQSSLENVYEDVKENHLRNLRRKLPFTG